MNIAVIFAGGTGQRMNTSTKPKQFLEHRGKPIIIYTLEHFENHDMIDGIIIVCLEGWIRYCRDLVDKFHITKVRDIVPGGETGLLSRYNGVKRAAELFPEDSVCLMHDGVRPLIDGDIITRNIKCVEENGSCVTVAPAVETIALKGSLGLVEKIIDRSRCQLAKAPQSFRLGELLSAHEGAVSSGVRDCIDTAYLMQGFGHSIYTVEGPQDNIKITTPADFYTFRALVDIRDHAQVFAEE